MSCYTRINCICFNSIYIPGSILKEFKLVGLVFIGLERGEEWRVEKGVKVRVDKGKERGKIEEIGRRD